MRPGLDALMIPKANGAADVERIANYLDALEARAGMAQGSVKLAIVATETAKAMFALGSYAPAHPRLAALTWGGEDLAAAVGATANREDDGAWAFPYEVARAQCLFAASRRRRRRDRHGVRRFSRHGGFRARLPALPPRRLYRPDGDPPGPGFRINRCYAPSSAEVERAQKIVAAFEANPGAGTLGIDGKMVDIPHLKAARKILASI